jgi:LysR family glycine cleavage system transcriptional activator
LAQVVTHCNSPSCRISLLSKPCAFEAAARLTHGAISHRIRALEAQVGAPLFERRGNTMQPTAAAARLLPTLTQSLNLLVSIFPDTPYDGPVDLRISTLPSLASRWLVPRLPDFHAAHPDIGISLDATLDLVPLNAKGVDAAIRFGEGRWPSITATHLAKETVFPVCSPAFRDRNRLGHPEDLRHCRLLRHSWQPWAAWFQVAGVNIPEPSAPPAYDDAGLLIDAAIAGDGVALARRILVADSCAEGKLVRPFDIHLPVPGGYYFARGSGQTDKARETKKFSDWVRERLAEM